MSAVTFGKKEKDHLIVIRLSVVAERKRLVEKNVLLVVLTPDV